MSKDVTHFCSGSSLYLGCQAATTSKFSGERSIGIVTKLSPSIALDGKNAIESVVFKYMGTMEKHGAETTTLRFNPN
ncbi:hypothetical protein V12B01_13310 [Vibrio splendidus 12B01]|nr:hypothetical protein V12B01_13310 [Vibrio splendidus 12B01]